MSELLISFPDQSGSFTNGVEFGRILERMERGEDWITNNDLPVHKENIEVIKRAAKVYGYACVFGIEESAEWVGFMALKKVNSEN